MFTLYQAKSCMAHISMMPSVVMVGVDRSQGGVSIGMELDKTNVNSDVDDLLLGLMTAYLGISLKVGYKGDELIERSNRTMSVILTKMTKEETETVH
jgi:hypothetical protein